MLLICNKNVIVVVVVDCFSKLRISSFFVRKDFEIESSKSILFDFDLNLLKKERKQNKRERLVESKIIIKTNLH